MKTEIKFYDTLPSEAKALREEVFMLELGFSYDADEIDSTATHIVVYNDSLAVAVCRVFEGDSFGEYILGRLAVKKEHRNKGLGGVTVNAAIEYTAKSGGSSLVLHSQLSAKAFYEKLGFIPYGEIEYEEDCPHIWMRKAIQTI